MVNASCAEESFVFSDDGKALQLRILKICDVGVNGTDESLTYPATRIKFCVAGYAVRRNLFKTVFFVLKGPQTDFSRVAKEVKCYFR